MSKRANNLQESNYPLVSVQRFQAVKCEVNTRQVEELARYISYVESVTGEKPTDGEVIGVALSELFKLDRGFQRWKEGVENATPRPKAPTAQSSGD
jgi:hypothetical protein